MADDYLPIACAEHERLEFAVLKRRKLRLVWLGEVGREHCAEEVLPIDVATRAGAEWLTIQRAGGGTEEVRLDRIQSVSEL